jgi:hypothetical protein
MSVSSAELVAEAEAMRPPNQPTEAMVGPVSMALRRSWRHGTRPVDGSWYACLDVGPVERVWECRHEHDDEDGAWECARVALQLLVIDGVNPGAYTW